MVRSFACDPFLSEQALYVIIVLRHCSEIFGTFSRCSLTLIKVMVGNILFMNDIGLSWLTFRYVPPLLLIVSMFTRSWYCQIATWKTVRRSQLQPNIKPSESKPPLLTSSTN